MKRSRGRGVIDVNADAGTIKARRMVASIVEAERTGDKAAAE